jgi:hypothetical protein
MLLFATSGPEEILTQRKGEDLPVTICNILTGKGKEKKKMGKEKCEKRLGTGVNQELIATGAQKKRYAECQWMIKTGHSA